MSVSGKLYLLPVPISEGAIEQAIPTFNLEVIKTLKKFIAEDARTARRFLKSFGYADLDGADILLLNEHTRPEEISLLLQELLKGEDIGLMSDAGCPGIADPGASVVALAHQKGVDVVPLVGPSSIVLSIMASGFNGQNFSFVGYLPIEKPVRVKKIRDLELHAQKQNQGQFFIETPYRNDQLLATLLETLGPQTMLFIGTDLMGPNQMVRSKTVSEWKRSPKPEINKVPTVFGIYR